jgi:transcription initiation factor TFIIIB Brf1 subunit/transcription initiation factor TFIIB
MASARHAGLDKLETTELEMKATKLGATPTELKALDRCDTREGLVKLICEKQAVLSSSDRHLKIASTKVKAFATQLRLSDNIVERCLQFLKFLSDKNQLGQSHKAAWYYSLIYLACREENSGRTIRELSHAGAQESDELEQDKFEAQMKFETQMSKMVVRLKKALQPALRRQSLSNIINLEELAPRFAAKLQLSANVGNSAVQIAKNAQTFLKHLASGGSSSEQVVQSAVIVTAIFIVCHTLDLPENERPRLADLSNVAKIPQKDIVETYEKLHPHIRSILPEALSTSSKLSTLPSTLRQTSVTGLQARR